MNPPLVRDMTDADLAAVTAIYAESVLNGPGTFELIAPDRAEMARRMKAVEALGLPRLAAEIDGAVVGYAYAGPFRTRAAYRFTVEDSIYVAEGARGRGAGRALLTGLIARCEALGVRQMLGVIGDSGNAGSVALHTACGFRPIGVMADAGWKFDRWLDVVLMQLPLGDGGRSPPDGPGLPLRDGPTN